ncbi:hypothetical protein AVEN_37642-1, partial [Araneus ventricosus]
FVEVASTENPLYLGDKNYDGLMANPRLRNRKVRISRLDSPCIGL